MKSILLKWNFLSCLLAIAFLNIITCFTIVFNIPIARQILGFIYFSFVPGFIFIKLLKFNEISKVETILFSIGLSIAFLALGGFVLNEFSLLLGISQPLSTIPLLIILNAMITIGAILLLRKNWQSINQISCSFRSIPLFLFLAIFLIMCIVGAVLATPNQNNIILLVIVMAIPVFVLTGLFSKTYSNPKFYPILVVLTALGLLLSSTLISKNLLSFGSDIQSEFFVAKTTQNDFMWNSTNSFLNDARYQRLNAMLSVSVLPVVYSSLLNLEIAWVFKIIFPLILSLVPLALYQLWQAHIGKKYALIAAFFFIAEATFYTEMPGLARQIIAELFFALILIVMFNKKIKGANKLIIFTVFSVALVTSHYAIAEIFFFFTLLSLMILVFMKKPRRDMLLIVVLFAVLMFSWYIFTANSSTYDAFVNYGEHVLSQQSDFFNLGSRGKTVLLGLGIETAPSIWNTVSRIFAYATEALILLGFIGLVTKRIKIKFERTYLIFSIISVILLAALVVVPGLARTLNMSRFYHILLFFLAPLGVMGGIFLIKLLRKRQSEFETAVLLMVILVPYFLFQTGFIYNVTGSDNWSLPLGMHEMSDYRLHRQIGYIRAVDVSSANWFLENVPVHNYSLVYADESSRNNILISYGMMQADQITVLSNTTTVQSSGVVYLNWLNVAKGTVAGTYQTWKTEDVAPSFDFASKIYSNGDAEIYVNTSPPDATS